MGEILTKPSAGFYMRDFLTSPDICQMFGEMIGVWSMLLWEQMGKPDNLAIIELGPGRGTVMADLIRGTAKFKEFAKSLSMHLVECSLMLQKVQETALHTVSKSQGLGSSQPSPMSWYMELDEVPQGVPCIIIAHEFYDALPIHQFQKPLAAGVKNY